MESIHSSSTDLQETKHVLTDAKHHTPTHVFVSGAGNHVKDCEAELAKILTEHEGKHKKTHLYHNFLLHEFCQEIMHASHPNRQQLTHQEIIGLRKKLTEKWLEAAVRNYHHKGPNQPGPNDPVHTEPIPCEADHLKTLDPHAIAESVTHLLAIIHKDIAHHGQSSAADRPAGAATSSTTSTTGTTSTTNPTPPHTGTPVTGGGGGGSGRK